MKPATHIALMLALCAGHAGADIIRNGSFETGENWHRIKMHRRHSPVIELCEIPADWYLTGRTGAGAYRHAGSLDGNDHWYTNGWYTLNQRFRGLEPDRSYTVSYYGKGGDRGHLPRLILYWNGKKILDMNGPDTSGNWVYYSRTFTVREREVTGGLITLNSLWGPGRAASFDAVSIEPVNAKTSGSAQAAVFALAATADRRAVEPLITLLADTHAPKASRRKAAIALGGMGKAAVDPLIAFVLAEMARPAAELEALIKQLDASDYDDRISTIGEIIESGHAILPLLEGVRGRERDPVKRRRLDNIIDAVMAGAEESFVARAHAIGALGESANAKAVEIILEALKDGHHAVRAAAATALGKLKDRRALPPLAGALEDPDEDVRENAVRALLAFNSAPALQPLLAVLDTTPADGPAAAHQRHVRQIITLRLAEAKDKRAVPPLIAMLRDRKAHVQFRAVTALGDMGETAVKPLIAFASKTTETETLLARLGHEDFVARNSATETLLKSARQALPLARMALDESDDPEIRWRLGRIIGHGATTKDGGVPARALAVRALGKIADKRAVTFLMKALSDDHLWKVRAAAADALGNIRDERAKAALTRALDDSHDDVRSRAASALLAMDPDSASDILAVAERRADASASAASGSQGAKPTSDKHDEAQDRIFLTSTDQLSGRVTRITADGILSLDNPAFRKPVRVPINEVTRIIPGTDKKISDGPDSLSLASGERLRGRLHMIDNDSVVIRTVSMGDVRVRRNAVATIELHADKDILFASDFSHPARKRWWPQAGKWEMQAGKFRSTTAQAVASTPVRQEGPVTVEWTVSGLTHTERGGLLFFVDEASAGRWGRNSINLQPFDDEIHVYRILHGRVRRLVAKMRFGRTFASATFRAAYEPSSGRVRVWVNGKNLGRCTLQEKIMAGRYVHLYSRNPATYHNVRLVTGAPGIVQETKPKETKDFISLTNRDRITGALTAFRDGTAYIKAAHGELRIDRSRMDRIVFRTKGLEAAVGLADFDFLFHGGTAFSAKLIKMEAETIEVESQSFGSGKISWDAVRLIICPAPGPAEKK